MKKVLVAVTGISPQILTETIYALAMSENSWIPDEVHVVTTLVGQEKIKEFLFLEGYFLKLCQEYSLPYIHFTMKDSVHVICNDEGCALADIQTQEDNSLAADQIVHFIHDLCQQSDVEVHVSIAGGRKSMGFYIGYALSLFGRRQDRMSHVLVSEPYEQSSFFFYPTKSDEWISLRGSEKKVNARLAKVVLADIPFVRMGEGLPRLDLSSKWDFNKAVTLTQTKISDFGVIVNVSDLTLEVKNLVTVRITPRDMCIYLTFVELAEQGLVYINDSKNYHHENIKAVNSLKFLELYRHIQKKLGRDSDSELDEVALLQAVRETSSRIKRVFEQANLGTYAAYFGIESLKAGKYYRLALNHENIEVS